MPLHTERLPNESDAYRAARDRLLEAERDARRKIEEAAAMRRALPLGGEVPQDYVFASEAGPVRLSELFGDKPSLLLYSYMFSEDMPKPCPMCSSFLDGLDRMAAHATQVVPLAVVAMSPMQRILEVAQSRGWTNLRMLSSQGASYHRDYLGETANGGQNPMMNVFVQRDGKVHHSWASELFFVGGDKGEHPRHIDQLWPLWALFDLTPEGRPANWYPALAY